MKTFKEYRQQQIEEGKFADALIYAGTQLGKGIGWTAGHGGELAYKAGKGLAKGAWKLGKGAAKLGKGAVEGLAKATAGQLFGHRHYYDYDRDEEKEKGKDEAKRDQHLATMKTHATGLGFDPNDSTSMSGYHAYMDRFTQGHPHASTHPGSGLAWDTSSSRMWRGAHGSRTPRHQAAHEHDAAKQAWQWLKGKGHI